MDKEQKKILEGLNRLKDAIEGYLDNMELDEAETVKKTAKSKKEGDGEKGCKDSEKEKGE